MADIEEGDAEVFEITDFTSASDWERFIGAVTELLHEWRAAEEAAAPPEGAGRPSLRQAQVDFAGCVFTVAYVELPGRAERQSDDEPLPPALAELAAAAADFQPAHPVAEAFGVRRFVALQPAAEPGVNNESKARIMLSSLHVALRDAGWDIPMFVQVHKLSMLYYLGACVGDRVLIEFHTILLKRAPPDLYFLSGLLDLFKQKLSSRPVPPVSVSLQLQFSAAEFGPWTYRGEAADPAELEAVFPEPESLRRLPLDAGADLEPLAGLDLMTSWHQVAETLLVEDAFSQLSPRNAPRWTVRARPTARAVGLLGLCLRDVWLLCHRMDTFESLVGRRIRDAPPVGQAPDVAAALSRLTDRGRPSPASSAAPSAAAARPADLTDEYVDRLCRDLFSDQETAAPPPAVPAALPRSVKNHIADVKSSRPGDLLWRLGQVMCLLARSRSASLACRVWERFIQELRKHWETVQPVPGVEGGNPSFTTALLHQKLQMLNCCIEKRAQGMKNAQDARDGGDARGTDTSSQMEVDEDEDEFFDAPEEGADEPEVGRQRLPWNQPEGRLKLCGSLKLLETGEDMYIPITQEVAPMTEDRLQEQSQVLVSLGTDSEGCQLRARMMAASLTSDMEAFKAANPGSTLGDFVRWYSPRDWVQETADDRGTGGELSPRMQIADNLWVETWNACKPVPARRQRRLFDETREAEQVFHQLAALRPADLFQLLAPVIYHAAVYRVVEEVEPGDLPALGPQVEEAARRLHSASKTDWDPRNYETVGKLLATCEHHILRRRSLALKLDGVPEKEGFVQQLVGGAEVAVPGGAGGDAALQLEKLLTYKQPEGRFPAPARKEYVLRVSCPRPGPGSRPLPHRLRCLIADDTFRVSASLSQDAIFS